MVSSFLSSSILVYRVAERICGVRLATGNLGVGYAVESASVKHLIIFVQRISIA